jgi:hypothetical protein
MLAHPSQSFGDSSGMKVKRGADADQDGRLELTFVLGHPAFLLRRPRPTPTTSARTLLIMETISSSSCCVIGRNGGQ